MRGVEQTAEVSTEQAGQRLDKASAALFPDYSRNQLKQWIESGNLLVNGSGARPRDKVFSGDQLRLVAVAVEQVVCEPEDIPLDVIYEDQELLVINKPAGLVVHPAAGNWRGTLQNGLLYRDPEAVHLPRAGIVHRLDKDTSGVMVVARTARAHKTLVEALQKREVSREYRAVVTGSLISGGAVDAPIGRHPTQRTRMAVVNSGKPAVTHFRVLERFRVHTLLQVNLESGRTHQIRVHMAHLHHPVTGDPVYGGRLRVPSGASPELIASLRSFRRQALHAYQLSLVHPVSGESMQWQAPIPDDLQQLLQCLGEDAGAHED